MPDEVIGVNGVLSKFSTNASVTLYGCVKESPSTSSAGVTSAEESPDCSSVSSGSPITALPKRSATPWKAAGLGPSWSQK